MMNRELCNTAQMSGQLSGLSCSTDVTPDIWRYSTAIVNLFGGFVSFSNDRFAIVKATLHANAMRDTRRFTIRAGLHLWTVFA